MTQIPFLDLSRQITALRAELDAAVASVLDGGRFVGGEPVERFEREFADWCGTAHAIGVASGTDAIAIALQAVGIGVGDEVITVANTCVPTVAGIEGSGATPVLVDADPRTMTIDPERVAAAVGPRTRAIVPVHLYGLCADMDALLAIAREHNLRIVEDCAQAHGASYRNRPAGTMGDAAAFSFYPTKNLGALGDAGAVVTSDAAAAERARILREYGEPRRYESVVRGTNSRLDTLQAALLSVKLDRVDGWNDVRRAIARRYDAVLTDTDTVPPPAPSDRLHAYHLYVVRVADRDRFRARLLGAGVETLVHYPKAVHQHPAYAGLGARNSLQVSEQLAAEVVSLPLYPEMHDDEIETVTTALVDSA